jgi:hypothetical protein
LHRVRIRREWLATGGVIELELPRNLACAACGGGGCDICGRSGAISLRKRDELPEIVEVTLPVRPVSEEPESRGVTLRIPEQGGLPPPGSELPRGLLLLTVVPSDEADPNVALVPTSSEREEGASSDSVPRVPSEAKSGREIWRVVLVVAVALWILLLIWLRLTGRG